MISPSDTKTARVEVNGAAKKRGRQEVEDAYVDLVSEPTALNSLYANVYRDVDIPLAKRRMANEMGSRPKILCVYKPHRLGMMIAYAYRTQEDPTEIPPIPISPHHLTAELQRS